MSDATPRRVIVVGTSGSGKTTFGRRLAQARGVRHVELDALRFLPGWKLRPVESFRELVTTATGGEDWVADGNYSMVRDIVWSRVTDVVWLDIPFPLVMKRLLERTFRRSVSREALWEGNRESLWKAFFSRESILLWAITSHRRLRQRYAQLFRADAFRHVRFHRVRTPGEADALLGSLAREEPPVAGAREPDLS